MFEKQDLLQGRTWLGVFYPSEGYDRRIPGELRYAPELGVQLKYLSPHQEPPYSEYLHGILETGEKCTLFGKIDPFRGGHSQRGELRTFHGVQAFPLLAVGSHCSPDSTFNELAVTYSGMQEFFFETGFKEWEPFHKEIYATIPAPWGRIDIHNTGSFLPMSKSPEVHFHSDDEEALHALKSALEEVSIRFPQAHLQVKKDVGFGLLFVSDAASPLKDFLPRVEALGDLLAILRHQPVHPQSLHAMCRSGSDAPSESVDLYPSYVLDRDTLALATEPAFGHRNLAITGKSVNFNGIVERWLQDPRRYETLTSALQHERRFKTLDALHGDVVLYLSMLEAITRGEKGPHSGRYQYPIDKYAGEDLRTRLLKLLNVGSSQDAGTRLSALRGEIAHVGRPRALLRNVDGHGLLKLTTLLQLLVVTQLLESLGADADQIRRYQHLALWLRS